MNHIYFAVGDRVKHKVAQIQGEIVQLEESLAMPHAWVIEPSVCDVNPPKLYRLIDLEKVEDSGKGAQKNNQAQDVNPNISRGNQQPEVDSSTSKDFSGKSVLTVSHEATTVSTEFESLDLTVENETITVRSMDHFGVLTVENSAITVSTKFESLDLTVENEATLRSESVLSEQIASKPIPITVRSSSNTISNTSTSNELLSQQDLTVEDDSTTVRSKDQLPVLTVENQTTTVRSKDQLPVLTVENQTTTVSTEPESFVLTVENDTTEGVSDSKTQRSNNRRKGEGTGRIQLRTITKQNGKQYQQFWYDWQVHTPEKTIYKNEA